MSAKIHKLVTAGQNDCDTPKKAPLHNSEYISKVINDYINNDAEEAASLKSAQRGGGRTSCYHRDEVLKSLSKMQLTYKSEYVPGQKVNINTDEFKRALMTSMASLSANPMPKNMNQIDGRTIDFVEMIFGAFLRDKNTSDAIKTLLLRMQIPVIKTAMMDFNFFHNNKHPARNVLDTIAHLGIGIEDKENTLYQTMGLIIDQLLRSFEQNTVSFHTALSSLNRLTKIEQEKQQQNEKQTQRQILQEHGRQLVLTELQFHIKKGKLPKAVQPLILKHWSTLMFHRYIRHGNNSEPWNDAVNLLKKIVYSLKPIKTRTQFMFVSKNHEDIVESVTQALAETKQSKEHIFMSLNSLKRIYEKTLEVSEFSQQTGDLDELINDTGAFDRMPDTEADAYESSPLDKKIELARKKIAKLPGAVRPGVWFEIYAGDDHPVRRLKLSVIILEQAKLVFVDRLGVKIMEKDALEFTEELNNKLSNYIADHSVFDHALTQVITSIAANHR